VYLPKLFLPIRSPVLASIWLYLSTDGSSQRSKKSQRRDFNRCWNINGENVRANVEVAGPRLICLLFFLGTPWVSYHFDEDLAHGVGTFPTEHAFFSIAWPCQNEQYRWTHVGPSRAAHGGVTSRLGFWRWTSGPDSVEITLKPLIAVPKEDLELLIGRLLLRPSVMALLMRPAPPFWIVVHAYYELFIHSFIFIECVHVPLSCFILVTWHLLLLILLCCSPEDFFTFCPVKGFFPLFFGSFSWGQKSEMSYVYRL